jgi:DNA polymerase-3 subunit epsilon
VNLQELASLLPRGLVVDGSRRAAHGIRISLPIPAPSTKQRVQFRFPLRPLRRSGAAWWGPPDEALPATDRLRSLEYVVVDVETTGGSLHEGHRITEICAVRLRGDGTPLGEFATLVNPLRPIPARITLLTRITHDMVEEAPRFAEIADSLADFLDGAVFVAHNAMFDWRFVTLELERAALAAPHTRVLCTVRLARKVVPEVASRSLDALSYFFGVENEARHRAFGDARATARIFSRLLERMDEREIVCWADLEALLLRSTKRRKRSAMPQPMTDA